MDKICFSCDSKNSAANTFCSACGSPLSLDAFISRSVSAKLEDRIRDRDVLETESAIKVFERAWGWVKLVGTIAASLIAILVAGGVWQYINLRSTVSSAQQEVQSTKLSAEAAITSAATANDNRIKAAALASITEITTTANSAKDSIEASQASLRKQSSQVSKQALATRTELSKQAETVTKDVVSARQQIEAASKLQPEMRQVQEQLASAQAQIQQQQKVITSSEDFAKKIFSSHVQLLIDLKTFPANQAVTVDVPDTVDGQKAVILYLVLPSAPLMQTLQIQFNQTIAAPNSYLSFGNVLGLVIQRDAVKALTEKVISVGYFPDPSVGNLPGVLTIRNGQPFIGNAGLPYKFPSLEKKD